jgi:ATP-binding cassette subfamily D (ALD) long-chain fatty acid import protein
MPASNLVANRQVMSRIIYPHAYTQFVQSGRTKEELMEILEAVHLAYLPAREGGWETRKEWRDVLSGGEKQRVSESSCLRDVLCR